MDLTVGAGRPARTGMLCLYELVTVFDVVCVRV